MSVFLICEQAIGLVRGKRLILSDGEKSLLESLNYEALTAAHVQDEAVVCALHFARVRDRLLQIYPWAFARKSAAISGGGLPSDCLTVLAVLVNGEPIEYEQIGTSINITQSCNVRYTAKITDTNKWSDIFRDVFCYSLAIEINSAVTGEPQFIQILEQKAQELITRAHQIGAIQAETRVSLAEELYNRAIGFSRGQRTVKTTSTAAIQNGVDNYGYPNDKTQAEIRACKRAADSVRDRLLELYPWTFARKTQNLTSGAAKITGWDYAYNLPSDCMKVISVISDNQPVDFEENKSVVYCNSQNPSLRYTAQVTSISSWPGVFRDVFCYSLAEEIVSATTQNNETIQLLEQKLQLLIRNAIKTGAIKNGTKLTIKQELYRRAVNLTRGQRTIKPDSEAALEQGVDITGFPDTRYQAEIQACEDSAANIRDKLLQLYPWVFARKSQALTSQGQTVTGWDYGFNLPDDCLTVLTVLAEKDGESIPAEWEESSGRIYCNHNPVTVRYTARKTDISEWPAAFADSFVYLLACEVLMSTAPASEATLAAIKGFEDAAQLSINQASQMGVIRVETRLPVKNALCARALGLLQGVNRGAAVIPDKLYQSEIASALRSFAGVRDKLLVSYAWTFARKTATPPLLSEGTQGWQYTFRLPDDCLKVTAVIAYNRRTDYRIEDERFRVSDFPQNVELLKYETAGRELYANRQAVHVRYTSRIENPEEWDAAFTEAFCVRLALEVSMNTLPDKNVVQYLEQRYTAIIQEAVTAGLIREDTGLPLQRESIREGLRRLPRSLDYAGISSNCLYNETKKLCIL